MKFLLFSLLLVLTFGNECRSNYKSFCDNNFRKCKSDQCGSCFLGYREPSSSDVEVEAETEVGVRMPGLRKVINLNGTPEENCERMSEYLGKCEPYDATFIMDGSGSICGDGKDAVDEHGECENFNNMEAFIEQTIDGSTKAKMKSSLIQFANYALMKVNWGQVVGKQNLHDLIEGRFQYTEGRTNMEAALRMYMDEVLPHIVDDETMHNIYILTDGIPTDNPCSLAKEWNERTRPYHINTFIVLVKDHRGAEKLSCLDATFIKVKDFDSLNCPSCAATRATCDEYECPAGYSAKHGTHYCSGRDCDGPENKKLCCDADMCHQLKKCESYDATFMVDSSGSICKKSMPRDADGECKNFNHIEHFVAQSISGSTKPDMHVGMVRFAGRPYLRRRWRELEEETDAEVLMMVDQKLQWYGGRTDMGEAIDLYMKKIYNEWESTKYKGRKYPGWKGTKELHNVYLLTDGEPTDDVCARADKFNKMVEPENISAFIVIVGAKHEEFTHIKTTLKCLNAKIIEVHNFEDLQCAGCNDNCKAGPEERPCENGGVIRMIDGKCICDCSHTLFTGAWCEMIKPCDVGINGKVCQNGGTPVGSGENCKCQCPSDEEGALYVGDNCQYHRTEVLYITPGVFSGAGKFFHFVDTEADRLTGMKLWYKHEWNIITENGRTGAIKIYKNSRNCDECGRWRDTPTVKDFENEKWFYFVDQIVKMPDVHPCQPKSQGTPTTLELEMEVGTINSEAVDDEDVATYVELMYANEADVGVTEEGSSATTYLMYAAACIFALGAGFRYGSKQSM